MWVILFILCVYVCVCIFFLKGIGLDGYIVFNELGFSLVLRIRLKILVMDIILVNVKYFDGDLLKVLIMVLIVGVGIVMDVREVRIKCFLMFFFWCL